MLVISVEFLVKSTIIVEWKVVRSTHRRQVHATTIVEVLTLSTIRAHSSIACICLAAGTRGWCNSLTCLMRRRILTATIVTFKVNLDYTVEVDYLLGTRLGLAKRLNEALATLRLIDHSRGSLCVILCMHTTSGFFSLLLYVSRGLIRAHSYLITKIIYNQYK